MAETIQLVSAVNIHNEKMEAPFLCCPAMDDEKTNPKDNLRRLISICDNMDELCIKLDILQYFLEKRLIDFPFTPMNKEEGNETEI